MFIARRIQRELSKRGWGSQLLELCKKSGVYDYFWRLENRRYVRRNQERLKRVCDSLADERSKQTYDAVLDFRCRGTRASHRQLLAVKLPENEQYFPEDLFQLGPREAFVDCGAYVGDTIARFRQHVTGGEYQAIYAFEPNPANLGMLRRYVDDHHLANVSIFNLGTYRQRDVLKFSNTVHQDSGGALQGGDGEEVRVDSLDNVLGDQPVTFIKMDVEGAELDSLRGAQNIIVKQKPRLAICIYHKTVDFLEIPEYIRELVPEYRFHVRHYTDNRTETVLYAVMPKE